MSLASSLGADAVLELNAAGLLADVLGFETDEVASGASGSRVQTLAGHDFLDFTGGIAVHACGHNHPEIVAAVKAQADSVLHTSDILRHAPQLELADFLRTKLALAGLPDASFVFLNGGSESIDAAAKLAIKVTGRRKLLAFDGAFHGRTMLATALSHSKTGQWSSVEPFLAPLRQHIFHAPAPRCAGCDLSRENCCVTGARRILESEMAKGDVAALFLEAQQGEGGYFPRSPESAQALRKLCDDHGTLLIADEVQAGMGRTGRFFAFERLGIVPHIVVFGKAVGGGLPLAGVAASRDLLAKWEPGEHGTTFGGNPIACAAGLAALRLIDRENLVARVDELGRRVKDRLKPLIGTHGVCDVRGNGFMLAIEFRDESGAPDYARAGAVKDACREQGLLLLTCGAKIGDAHADNAALRLIPPLNIPEADLWRGIGIVEDAIQA